MGREKKKERERERESLCVCVCVCGHKKAKRRQTETETNIQDYVCFLKKRGNTFLSADWIQMLLQTHNKDSDLLMNNWCN